MWEIKNPTIQKTKLDFTSSGQGFCEVSQLISNKIVVVNAIDFLEFEDDLVQLLICDHCGNSGCQSGNWVKFRKSGNFVLMIPAFDEMFDSLNQAEYNPPHYFEKEGTPYFTLQTYEKLLVHNFPPIEKIKRLKMSEAVRLFQFCAPMTIFGEPPQIKVNFEKSKNIISASEGEPRNHLRKIEEILRQNYENESTVNLRSITHNDEIVYLFIDDYEFVDWQPLIKQESNYNLVLGENFVIQEKL